AKGRGLFTSVGQVYTIGRAKTLVGRHETDRACNSVTLPRASRHADVLVEKHRLQRKEVNVVPGPESPPAYLASGAEVAGTGDREGDTSGDEWSLGWTTTGAHGLGEDVELDTSDSEHSVGWPASCSQGRDAWELGGYRYLPGIDSEN
ncbi:hypothetical protein, partial [Mesorhizobium sp. 98Argb]